MANTNNKALLFLIALCTAGILNAQSSILKPAFLNVEIDSLAQNRILIALDTLFSQIKNGKIDEAFINKEDGGLSLETIKSFAGIEESKEDSNANFYKKQLINLYPVSTNEYWISAAFIGQRNDAPPVLKNIINLIATRGGNKISFSIPTRYLTMSWKMKVVGNITYFFRDKIDLERAAKFNRKNTIIAEKLGLKPEKMSFYLCNNFQEALQLLGYEYDLETNGKTRDGYGVEANTIFSIMHNEDFSHDIFHHYSAQVRGDAKRNRTVEEGMAYAWGNAYYTNANGEMIEQKQLIQNLKAYLKNNSGKSLLELFNKDIKGFNALPAEISIKSTISSLLCSEVERKKGIAGIKALIKCGRGDDVFFTTLNDLISVNPSNFDKEVAKLIEQYK